jgi:hypothetical protein
VIATHQYLSKPPCAARRATWPNGECAYNTSYSLSYAGPRVPRGGVTRQGVVLTELQSLLDCQ